MGSRLVVRNVSTRQLLDMVEQLDDVIRELAIISAGVASGQAHATVPTDVLRTMDRARPVLFSAKEQVSRQASEARAAGAETLDVTVELPEEAAGHVRDALDALEAVDVHATGDSAMLIPPATPEAAAFRRWFFEQLLSGLRGAVRD